MRRCFPVALTNHGKHMFSGGLIGHSERLPDSVCIAADDLARGDRS
jgi:hypothetical protein